MRLPLKEEVHFFQRMIRKIPRVGDPHWWKWDIESLG